MNNQGFAIPGFGIGLTPVRKSRRQGTARSISGVLHESVFSQMLVLERKRSDRSGRPFGLFCLELDQGKFNGTSSALVSSIVKAVRETDIVGWYHQDQMLGVILTELGMVNEKTADIVLEKIGDSLTSVLDSSGVEGIDASIDFYPGDLAGADTISKRIMTFCPDLNRHAYHCRKSRFLKRCLDILGGAFFLALLFPALVAIAAAVKLTSKGPILFRQKRVGQFGRTFSFMKFRTMDTDCDPSLHEKYIEEFIKKSGNGNGNGDGLKHDGIYKLSRDPRVTKLGHFLRKTSLDELPQFWHVLMGDMSLVGPRPPIPYELKRYSAWHKRRILEAKPGITGPWQVEGRSKTTFDEMVRLDLQYAQNWSVKQDISLLLRTPWAVFKGTGAV